MGIFKSYMVVHSQVGRVHVIGRDGPRSDSICRYAWMVAPVIAIIIIRRARSRRHGSGCRRGSGRRDGKRRLERGSGMGRGGRTRDWRGTNPFGNLDASWQAISAFQKTPPGCAGPEEFATDASATAAVYEVVAGQHGKGVAGARDSRRIVYSARPSRTGMFGAFTST